VVCADGGALLATEVQPPGRRAMRAADFVAGLRVAALQVAGPPPERPH
jgi:methionyl-tRNA formyltransferase